jgi:aldose 1-epimerase
MPHAASQSYALLPSPDLHWIFSGPFSAAIAPDAGGSLASFFSVLPATGETRHWLRPASTDALTHCDPLRMASFPLVPWANRIRHGRFEFDGTEVQLPPNMGNSPHTIHGLGWQAPWQVASRSAEHIGLQMHYQGHGAWPFAFSATQTYRLDAHGLHISLAVRNSGTRRMPADLGHHPYFPHERAGAGTRVSAQVTGMWESDGELLPTRLNLAHPTVAALRSGMPLRDFALDNNFSGFGREARIEWPNGDSLHLHASAPLDYFVVYSPGDQDVFCMEPVSNCTDWLNLRSAGQDTAAPTAGGNVLAPGETLQANFRLAPFLGNPVR